MSKSGQFKDHGFLSSTSWCIVDQSRLAVKLYEMSILWDDFSNNLWTYVGFVHFLLKFLSSSTLFFVTGYVNVLSVNVSFYHDGKCIVTKVVSFRYFFFQ